MKTLDYFNRFAKNLDDLAWNTETAPWAEWAWKIVKAEYQRISALTDGRPLVVDLGTGTGAGIETMMAYADAATFIGVDFAEEMIHVASRKFKKHKNVELRHQRIDRLLLPEASVDMFVTAGSIHHIKNKHQIAKNLVAMLKPGGVFINMDHFKPKRAYQQQMEKLRIAHPVQAREYDEAKKRFEWLYQQDTGHPMEFHLDPYEFQEILFDAGFAEADVHVSMHPGYATIVGKAST